MKETIKIGFIIEQVLGHKTHALNLKEFAASYAGISPVFSLLPLPESVAQRMPIVKNDSIMQVGVEGYLELARLGPTIDIAFMHTQNVALYSGARMKKVPTIVSLDATPRQWFELNLPFLHLPNLSATQRLKIALLEKTRLKERLLHQVLHNAVHIVTWSQWAKNGVCQEFGILPEKITVLPPGINTQRFAPGALAPLTPGQPVRLLFVGGDFIRKGGEILLRWARQSSISVPWELHVVTRESVTEPPAGVIVHNDLQNNSKGLVDLYQQADIFVLPTIADTFGIVLQEAMASGLPVIASDIAAIPEVVQQGKTGFTFPLNDFERFSTAMTDLIEDPTLRRNMGAAARQRALEHWSIEVACGKLVDLLVQTAQNRGQSGRR